MGHFPLGGHRHAYRTAKLDCPDIGANDAAVFLLQLFEPLKYGFSSCFGGVEDSWNDLSRWLVPI